MKSFNHEDDVHGAVRNQGVEGLTLTSCQATWRASFGDAVFLTRRNIGCVAAAVSLGLADARDDRPIQDSLVYTDIMRDQSGAGSEFLPPSPKGFQDGIVYACATAGRPDFGLSGESDSGRFKDVSTAKAAVSEMIALQPASMSAVFLYSPSFTELDVITDVVVLSVRPVELTRLIQGYWFLTGERVNASMGGLRMVNSDLIARLFPSALNSLFTWVGIRVGVPIHSPDKNCKPMARIAVDNPREVYLDHDAATCIRDEIKELLVRHYTEHDIFRNPSSSTNAGKRAFDPISLAHDRIAGCPGVAADEIVFTGCGPGCGPEANNLSVGFPGFDSGSPLLSLNQIGVCVSAPELPVVVLGERVAGLLEGQHDPAAVVGLAGDQIGDKARQTAPKHLHAPVRGGLDQLLDRPCPTPQRDLRGARARIVYEGVACGS